MALPTTYLSTLVVLMVSLVALGSWANALKRTGKLRFELFYYDYSIGVVLCALAAALALGSLDSKELTFSDNLLIASKRQMAIAVAAGVVFNLANLLLVAAVSVAGMAVAFPISFGVAVAIGAVFSFVNSQDSPLLLFGGVATVLLAVVLIAVAYRWYSASQAAAARGRSQRSAALGIVLSAISGLVMSGFFPLIQTAQVGDSGVGPYGIAVFVALGVLMSSLFYIPFFMNFPVQGKPVELREYSSSTKTQHLLGVLAGVTWMVGALCRFAATQPLAAAQLAPPANYALTQGAPLLAMLWGLLAWREFKGANYRVGILVAAVVVLFTAGLALISLAP